MSWDPIDNEQLAELIDVMQNMTGVNDGYVGPHGTKTIGQLVMMLNERLTRVEADRNRANASNTTATEQLQSQMARTDQLAAAIRAAERELTNLQPHIPQSCHPQGVRFIDSHIDVALRALRAVMPEHAEPLSEASQRAEVDLTNHSLVADLIVDLRHTIHGLDKQVRGASEMAREREAKHVADVVAAAKAQRRTLDELNAANDEVTRLRQQLDDCEKWKNPNGQRLFRVACQLDKWLPIRFVPAGDFGVQSDETNTARFEKVPALLEAKDAEIDHLRARIRDLTGEMP